MRRAVVIAAVAVALTGCGYRFAARGGELPGGARTLFVPMFDNRTAEPGVEAFFTEALRGELARAGREGGEGSDALVEGEVTAVTGGPAIYTTRVVNDIPVTDKIASFRVYATATVRVRRGGEKLTELTVSGAEDYQPAAGTQYALETEANRRNALRRLARTLMRQAYEGLAAGF